MTKQEKLKNETKTRKIMSDEKTLARFGHATVSDWFKGKAHWELSDFYFQ